MGERIDDINEMETLKEKARKWDALMRLIEPSEDYQKWLKSQPKGEKP